MEKDFKKRVKNLEKKQVDELRALELKYIHKQASIHIYTLSLIHI